MLSIAEPHDASSASHNLFSKRVEMEVYNHQGTADSAATHPTCGTDLCLASVFLKIWLANDCRHSAGLPH